MKSVGIFYASKGGVTENFAKIIASKLGADLHNMKDAAVDAIAEYKNVILMASSYYFGAIQEDWGSKIKLLHTIDFTNKTVALVGIGGAERHADSFCSGIADFKDKIGTNGVKYIGEVDASDYNFTFSRAQVGQKMMGLCLDKGNGEEKNNARINAWVEAVKPVLL